MTQRHPVQSDVPLLITTVVRDREPIFYNQAFARETVEALYRTQERHPFLLYGFVVMPDHLHLLLKTMTPMTVALVMNRFKTCVSHSIGIGPMWQRRFHIRIVCNVYAALDYIHCNPCAAGICETPEEYPWSSACGRWDTSPLDA